MSTSKKLILSITTLLFAFYVFGKINSNIVTSSFELLNNKVQKTFENGDIIFQTSESKQCEAVRIATNSKFSHCGIIFIENENPFVLEAVQPVKLTPLKQWITHGKEHKYVVKRLKNNSEILNELTLNKMKVYGKNFENKDYDLYFEWSDDKIYCSELVWKIYYNAAAIKLCELKSLKDFNLKDPVVQKIMKERYGNKIPYNEKVVAPSQLYESDLLESIFDNY